MLVFPDVFPAKFPQRWKGEWPKSVATNTLANKQRYNKNDQCKNPKQTYKSARLGTKSQPVPRKLRGVIKGEEQLG